MVREHRWAYAGLAAVIFGASLLAGSSLALRMSAASSILSDMPMSPADRARATFDLESARLDSGFMVGVAAIVGVILATQTMASVVGGRHREFAQLRLLGAMPHQIMVIVLRETVVVALLSSVAGAGVSLLLVRPYSQLLGKMGDWPAGVESEIHPIASVWCVATMIGVASLGALLTVRPISRGSAYGAAQQVPSKPRRMSVLRWVLVAIGAVPVVLLLLIPARSIDFTASAALVGGGAVLAASALSPVVVPALGRVVSGLLTPATPGAALMAREGVAHYSQRTAALATPIIVLLGMGAVFAMTAQTVKAAGLLELEKMRDVGAVAEAQDGEDVDSEFANASTLPEVGSIARLQSTPHWSWRDWDAEGGDPTLDLVTLSLDTAATTLPLAVEDGDLGIIEGTNVAAIDGSAEVGEYREIVSPDGTVVRVRIVAVLQSDVFVHGDFVLDLESFPVDLGAVSETWYATANAGISDANLAAKLDAIAPEMQVRSRASWIDLQIAEGVASQRIGIVTIVGGAALLTLFSLAQSTFTSAVERRSELRLLATIGARRRSVVGTVMLESVIVTVTAAVLALVITIAVYLRLAVGLDAAGLAISPVIPVSALLLIGLACGVVVAGSSALGGLVALGKPVRHGKSSGERF